MSSHCAKNIVVVGGGGHARVIISLIRKLASFNLLGYTDPAPGESILGVPYLGDDQQLALMANDTTPCAVALGIGNTAVSSRRSELAQQLVARGFELPALVSPAATVNEGVTVGPGTVIFDGVVVATGTQIGAACILNTGCVVDHDCRLGDGVHIAPGAVLCGGVSVGDFSMIGSGATVIHGCRVAARCLVGAGATVVTNLDCPATYVGTPARPVA